MPKRKQPLTRYELRIADKKFLKMLSPSEGVIDLPENRLALPNFKLFIQGGGIEVYRVDRKIRTAAELFFLAIPEDFSHAYLSIVERPNFARNGATLYNSPWLNSLISGIVFDRLAGGSGDPLRGYQCLYQPITAPHPLLARHSQ
ncbi:MAG: hypothetical protein PHH00_04150 [Candidatus Nanoarchaeia archaeon]|nr:hypothetical protein [Candidatus Nanoarchaeia archaeon]